MSGYKIVKSPDGSYDVTGSTNQSTFKVAKNTDGAAGTIAYTVTKAGYALFS